MTAPPLPCRSCGTAPDATAKFCSQCGTRLRPATRSAEYKQVTVLFADVVRSMDIAAAVGAERLREIMAAILDKAATVVTRYGGTVDKFTGDGVMAVFGAPSTLEDHALRACLGALEIQREMGPLAAEVQSTDDIALQVRIGLNSGQVIAGEIGSTVTSYTAIGEQVGLAQRMESAAPPGGVMLSESTARLVENAVDLGQQERVSIKGADRPVPARRLLGIGDRRRSRRSESSLVGRAWELNTITAILDEVVGGAGCVVNIVGPPGIGKSRLIRETAAIASRRGVDVFTVHCESHTRDVPFHVVARVLRAGIGVEDMSPAAARSYLQDRFPDADPEDLLLLYDLVGIRDGATELPDVAPDARRRRLTSLVNAAWLTRQAAAVCVVEDVHWIDDFSESMLAEFLAVVPRSATLVLVTYRPEYRGALSTASGAQTVALRPLSDAQAAALTEELLGTGASIAPLATKITERAAGNPFFVEEMVRDLAERGTLHGRRGAYEVHADSGETGVPATLQATIGARIDRLSPTAKHTLNAGAVIGAVFDADLLTAVADTVDVAPLIDAELVDQVKFLPRAEYAFRHPMIRSVAYGSQLKTDRAQVHRRLAATIQHDRASADENAALIAEHLEAAGDLHEAFTWHMRAGTWLTHRSLAAARGSWMRARDVADRMPDADAERAAMRIAPRTMLCVTAFLAGGTMADTGFDELRELAGAAGDRVSLAIGMTGWVSTLVVHRRAHEASVLAAELVGLIESIGDPTLAVGLLYAAIAAKYGNGEMAEALRLAQLTIELAGGDPRKGNLIIGSPLAAATVLGGCARCCLGDDGWRADIENGTRMVGDFDPTIRAMAMVFKYGTTVYGGAVVSDAAAAAETLDLLEVAQRSGDDFTLACARHVRGIALVEQDGADRAHGMALITAAHEAALAERFTQAAIPVGETYLAEERARAGDVDGAIELLRSSLDAHFVGGGYVFAGRATVALVANLLLRGEPDDVADAKAAVDRLAAVPAAAGTVLQELDLLRSRALLARADGDLASYRDFRDRYRARAASLGFEGHMKWAEAMP